MQAAARAREILRRFPRHLDVARPGKLFFAMVEALAAGLEVETAQLGRVRRAHRLAHADEHTDLLRLAATHALRVSDFAVLPLRLGAVLAIHGVLADAAAAPAAVDQALLDLGTALGLPRDAFPAFPGEADATKARERLAGALADLAHYASELDLLRARIRTAIALHRTGNGTVGALLGSAANQLDLDVEHISHTPDGYWHVARCRDRMRVDRPEPPGARPASTRPLPREDLLVLEENPEYLKQLAPTDRLDGERFHVLRMGFDPVHATVRVLGIEDRTLSPMVVNLDTGRGLVFVGAVPDGKELRFQADGQVLLDGADASSNAFAFFGGVFADGDAPHPRDFCFADPDDAKASRKDALFAVSEPDFDCFDARFVFPHESGPVPSTRLAIGETRFAFFVRVGHYGTVVDDQDVAVAPITEAGLFDRSVFAAVAASEQRPAAKVGFEWLEREAYAVRVWLPERFAALDPPAGRPVRELVRLALDRHRAAGVHVYTRYASERWDLPGGVLADLLDPTRPEGLVVSGTRLWPDGTAQPAPTPSPPNPAGPS